MLANANKTDEELTAAHRLFKIHYFIRCQNKFLYTDHFLKNKGIISTTPKEAEAEMNSFRMTAMTIAEIAILRNEGAQINFTEQSDCVKIYDCIVEHMTDWITIIQRGIYDRLPPSEDFYILDQLASELHPYVVRNQLRKANSGISSRNLGEAFFGNVKSELFKVSDAPAYKSKASYIINLASAYYGAKEFGFSD